MAASTDNPITTVTTTLTVKIIDSGSAAAGTPAATPAIPSDPGRSSRARKAQPSPPSWSIPTTACCFRPTCSKWKSTSAGKQDRELYEISLLSAYSEYRYYTRCYADPAKFLLGACALEIDADTVNVIAESNRGSDPLTLAVRGTDENGNVGSSASISVQFAADRVDGAIYYWTTKLDRNPAAEDHAFRFCFPVRLDVALQPSDLPDDGGNPHANTTCVGCHALSAMESTWWPRRVPRGPAISST